ncbi:MAG: hypothetical protein QXG35_08150 [Nitrososphaerota archaeon]
MRHLAEIYFRYDGSRANVKIYYDGGLVVNTYDSSVQSNMVNGIGQMIIGGRTGGLRNHHVGNGAFYVRKSYSPEPSHGAWGAEEAAQQT